MWGGGQAPQKWESPPKIFQIQREVESSLHSVNTRFTEARIAGWGGFNLPLVQSCNLVPAATPHLTITKKRFFLIIVKVSFVESKMWWGETIIIMFALFALVWRSKFFHLTDSSPATLTIDLWRAGEVPRGEFLVFLGGFLMGSVTMTEHLLLRWEIPATDAINLLESCSFHDPLSLHSCNDLHAGVDNKFA